MDRATLIKHLDDVLAEWEKSHRWGEFVVEVKDGVAVQLRTTVQQKLNSVGGMPHGRVETRSR
ncbi:MAG: hypothetical protein WAN23_06200 [Candidatus Acidiferrales bacterium]